MFSYPADLSDIPFQPGGDLYAVGVEQGYSIIRNRRAIDGVVVLEKGIGILAFGMVFLDEDQDCLISLEHAQAWVKAHRPELPCPYEDQADYWLKTSETLPADSRAVWVMADGTCRRAFFEKETSAFYPGEGYKRHLAKLVPVEIGFNGSAQIQLYPLFLKQMVEILPKE